MADEEKDELEEAGGGRSPILLIAIIGVVVLLGGGGAAYFFLAQPPASEEAAAAEGGETASADGENAEVGPDGEPLPPAFFSMEPFVVNINDGSKDRFLKLKVDLEVSSEAVSSELDQRLPQVKDIMIGLLSSQSFSDIRSMEGKDYLREELQTRLNAVVRKGSVQQVFFTEFVVQ